MTVETIYTRDPVVAAIGTDAEGFLVELEADDVFYLDELTSAPW